MTEESKTDNNIIINVDLNSEINYKTIINKIRDTLNHNHNRNIQSDLIINTNTNCKTECINIRLLDKYTIDIQVTLLEDTYCEKAIFNYHYHILTNLNTEYLLIVRLYILILQYRISQKKSYIETDTIYKDIQRYLLIDSDNNSYIEEFHYSAIDAVRNDFRARQLLNSILLKYKLAKKELAELLKLIEFRIKHNKKQDMLASRSIKSILGNFEEQISPNMVHKILTWLKKKNKKKYGNIKRGIKEQIIIDLKKHDIYINADLLCKFIDDNVPSKFAKEWNIDLYSNGKRLKNDELRKLFKEEFYKKEKESNRFKIVCPRLNSLPQNIEFLIIGYLVSNNNNNINEI